MPDFTQLPLITPLNYDDEKLDTGDTTEFVVKMNQWMDEQELFGDELTELISAINILAAELSDDEVLQARRSGYLTYETEAGMQAAGAPPTAAPAAELAWVWGDAVHANNGLYAYNTGTNSWGKTQPTSVDYGRGYQQSRQNPNLYLDSQNRNLAKWWTINGNGTSSDANVFPSTYQGKHRIRFDADEGTNVFMQCIDIRSFKNYGASHALYSFSMTIDQKDSNNTDFVSGPFNTRILVMQVTDPAALTHSGVEVAGTRQTWYLDADGIAWDDPDYRIKFEGVSIDASTQGLLVLVETAARFYCSDICICEGPHADYRLPEYRPVAYMSATGNDGTSGELATPVKSPWKALEIIDGRGRIIVEGGEYFENFDLGQYQDGRIEVVNMPEHEVDFFLGEKLGSAWVTHPTYANVWSIPSGNTDIYKHVFLHGQVSGLIDPSERHPLHRSRLYRNNTYSLTEANDIEDIQTKYEEGSYCWFDDGADLYITTVDGSHPNNYDVWLPSDDSIIEGAVNKYFEVRGLNVYYGGLYAKYCNYRIENTFICGTRYTGISRGFGHGVEINCEVAMCGHEGGRIQEAIGSEVYDDKNRRSDSGYLSIGMYSHDNYNIGERSQQRGMLIAQSGLYEYNGLGGVNSGYGSNVTMSGCLSRNNGTRYTDTTSTGLAYQYRVQSQAGYSENTDGHATTLKLTDCEAVGGAYGVVNSHDNCYIDAKNLIVTEHREHGIGCLASSVTELFNVSIESSLSNSQLSTSSEAVVNVRTVAPLLPAA